MKKLFCFFVYFTAFYPAIAQDILVNSQGTQAETEEAVKATAPDSVLKRSLIGVNFYVFTLSDKEVNDKGLDAILQRLGSDPKIDWAVEDTIFKPAQFSRNDSLYANQDIYLGDAPATGSRITELWQYSQGQEERATYLLDTGILYDHPDIRGKVVTGGDFVSDPVLSGDGDGFDQDATDPGDFLNASIKSQRPKQCADFEIKDSSWHGTQMASIMTALTDNNQGIAGIDTQGSVIPVRVAGHCGARLSDLIDAAIWMNLQIDEAAIRYDIVRTNAIPTMIVVGLSAPGECTKGIEFAMGVLSSVSFKRNVIVPAGNTGDNQSNALGKCFGATSVVALDSEGQKASYSSFGEGVSMAAFGGDLTAGKGIWVASNSGKTKAEGFTYKQVQGSSYSAAIVASGLSLIAHRAENNSGFNNFPNAVTAAKGTARAFAATGPSCSGTKNISCQCTTDACGQGIFDSQAVLEAHLERQKTKVQPNVAATQVAAPGQIITLDVSLTQDRGQGPLTYRWEQRSASGPTTADIASSNSATTEAVVPDRGIINPFNKVRYVLYTAYVTDSKGNQTAATQQVIMGSGNGNGFELQESSQRGNNGATAPSEQVTIIEEGGGGALNLLALIALGTLIRLYKQSRDKYQVEA